MTPSLRDRGVRAILLDIEGTTTPIAFVHDVLFPFARTHLRSYLRDEQGSGDLDEIITGLAAEHAVDVAQGNHPPDWRQMTAEETLASAETYALWLMARDRKSPALKRLQGQIWERGYRSGQLNGEVFPDTAPAIRRWRGVGLDVAIYSSGSVLAQRLLFESTPDGDLTALLSGFFDTAVGAKTSSDSYARICAVLGHDPHEVLFISDVTAELVAARDAGLQVRLSIRPGNLPQPAAEEFEAVRSFEEIPTSDL